MFKKIRIGAVVGVLVASAAMAIDPYTTRDVRDPVKLKARLDADFATVAAGVGVAAVTNASVTAQTATKAATVTTQTATVSVTVTPQTYVPTFLKADGTTNTVAIMTNATASFTGLTNVTVSTAGVTTNVTITLQTN